MKNTHGEKVKKIISENFDSRMEMAVVTYILDKGFDNLKEITEEDILKVKGNSFMTDRFCQALVRTAVMICKECNQIDEFLPFIINHLYVPKVDMKEIEIYKDDCRDFEWQDLLEKFNLEDKEDVDKINMIILNANAIEIR